MANLRIIVRTALLELLGLLGSVEFVGFVGLLGFVGLIEFVELLGFIELFEFVGLLEFIELIELLGLPQLRAQILDETRIQFGNDLGLIVNPFKIVSVDIFLIQGHIEFTLNFGS
jgi:hypothetical protein